MDTWTKTCVVAFFGWLNFDPCPNLTHWLRQGCEVKRNACSSADPLGSKELCPTGKNPAGCFARNLCVEGATKHKKALLDQTWVALTNTCRPCFTRSCFLLVCPFLQPKDLYCPTRICLGPNRLIGSVWPAVLVSKQTNHSESECGKCKR